MNAESQAVGTCSKGEDSSSLCRMEWNGGGGGGSGSGQTSSSTSSSSSGQGQTKSANKARYEQLLNDNGNIISQFVINSDQQTSLSLDQGRILAREHASIVKLRDPTPSRTAALAINNGLTDQKVIAWSVIELATRAFYPFADNDKSAEWFARELSRFSADWAGAFVLSSTSSSSFRLSGDNNRLVISTACLEVQIGRVSVLVKGPQSTLRSGCEN